MFIPPNVRILAKLVLHISLKILYENNISIISLLCFIFLSSWHTTTAQFLGNLSQIPHLWYHFHVYTNHFYSHF